MRLSIIIITWNVKTLLYDCLKSLDVSHLPSDWEIVIFDNASSDGTVAMLKEQFPHVKTLVNGKNIGYAAGNNLAASHAVGDYIFFLNPDTLASQTSVRQLLAYMDEHLQVGACSPGLLLPDETPQPYSFGQDPTPIYLLRRGLHRLLHNRPLHDWDVATPQTVDWVSGAAMLVRREAWERTGGFDENFFMYFEDNDLCLRMRQFGWEIVYYPQTTIIHLGGRSQRQNPMAQKAYNQSLLYFYRKHYGIVYSKLIGLPLWVYHKNVMTSLRNTENSTQ